MKSSNKKKKKSANQARQIVPAASVLVHQAFQDYINADFQKIKKWNLGIAKIEERLAQDVDPEDWGSIISVSSIIRERDDLKIKLNAAEQAFQDLDDNYDHDSRVQSVISKTLAILKE